MLVWSRPFDSDSEIKDFHKSGLSLHRDISTVSPQTNNEYIARRACPAFIFAGISEPVCSCLTDTQYALHSSEYLAEVPSTVLILILTALRFTRKCTASLHADVHGTVLPMLRAGEKLDLERSEQGLEQMFIRILGKFRYTIFVRWNCQASLSCIMSRFVPIASFRWLSRTLRGTKASSALTVHIWRLEIIVRFWYTVMCEYQLMIVAPGWLRVWDSVHLVWFSNSRSNLQFYQSKWQVNNYQPTNKKGHMLTQLSFWYFSSPKTIT